MLFLSFCNTLAFVIHTMFCALCPFLLSIVHPLFKMYYGLIKSPLESTLFIFNCCLNSRSFSSSSLLNHLISSPETIISNQNPEHSMIPTHTNQLLIYHLLFTLSHPFSLFVRVSSFHLISRRLLPNPVFSVVLFCDPNFPV